MSVETRRSTERHFHFVHKKRPAVCPSHDSIDPPMPPEPPEDDNNRWNFDDSSSRTVAASIAILSAVVFWRGLDLVGSTMAENEWFKTMAVPIIKVLTASSFIGVGIVCILKKDK